MILLLAIFFIILQQSIEAVANRYYPNFNLVLRKYHLVIILFYFLLWASLTYFFLYNGTPYWKLFLGYWFVACAISDTAWNLTSIIIGIKISIWYYGTTKWWDRTMTKLGSFGWFSKGVFGIVGIIFLL
jgi:hypothetical protein